MLCALPTTWTTTGSRTAAESELRLVGGLVAFGISIAAALTESTFGISWLASPTIVVGSVLGVAFAPAAAGEQRLVGLAVRIAWIALIVGDALVVAESMSPTVAATDWPALFGDLILFFIIGLVLFGLPVFALAFASASMWVFLVRRLMPPRSDRT